MEKKLTPEQTKEKALRLLEYRSHSEKELRDKLKRCGGENIDEVIEFCREYNFLNDREYAKRLAKDLVNLKKYGKRRVRDELRAKGIDEEYISEIFEEEEDGEEVFERLLPLVSKKLGLNFEQKNIDKTIRYFIYRGYEIGDIKRCIEEVKSRGEEEFGL